MKILQVLLSPRIGGAEALATSLEAAWSDNGAACRTHYLDEEDVATPSRSRRLKSVSRVIRDWRPDVVVGHSALPNLYARLAAPRSVPVVAVLHSAGDDFTNRSLRWTELFARRRTAAIVAVSQQQADQYLARFGANVPLRVIPNGIRPDALPRERFANNPSTAVTVARVASQKNPHLWVKTAKLLASDGPDLKLAWWGPHSVDSGLENIFNEEALQGTSASYQGATNDPITVLRSSDILFHTADREAHSIGILEAAAVGLPIVCSATVAGSLPDEIGAVSFQDGNPKAAVEALATVHKNWDFYAGRALDNASFIGDKYSIAKCGSEYMDLLSDILSKTTRKC